MTATQAKPAAAQAEPAATQAEPAATQVDDPDAIPMLRQQIDSLDAAIASLVAERTKLSRRIQTARMNAGGTRVELGRERVVLDAYRRLLGPDGAQLGEAVLRVCRGAR